MEKEFEILGCVQVPENMSYDSFWHKFINNFVEGNNWSFGGGINEIIDGFYINADGTRGKSVIEDMSSNLHDILTNELFQHHSLSALILLINSGRELEFIYKNTECFISKNGSYKTVSLWVNKKEQSFDSVEELIEKGIIYKNTFFEIFGQTTLVTLF